MKTKRTKPYKLRDGKDVHVGMTIYHYPVPYTKPGSEHDKITVGIVHHVGSCGELQVYCEEEWYGIHWRSFTARRSCFSTKEAAEAYREKCLIKYTEFDAWRERNKRGIRS